MEIILAILVTALVATGVTSMAWYSQLQQISQRQKTSEPDAPTPTEPDASISENRSILLQEVINITVCWQNAIMQSIQQMRQADSRPIKLLKLLVQQYAAIFPNTDVILAVASLDDILQMDDDTLNFSNLVDKMLVASAPELMPIDERALLYSFARTLRSGKAHSQKQWRTVQSLQLPDDALTALKAGSQGIFVPLRYNNSMIGMLLMVGAPFERREDFVRAHGEGAALLAQLLAYWIERQIDAETAPLRLKSAQKNNQNSNDQSQALLRELAAFSQFAMLRSAEFQHLAKQTCVSLLHICHADYVAFLLRTPQSTFRVDAVETKRWSWSRRADTQTAIAKAQRLYNEEAYQSWPDPFVHIISECRRPMRLLASHGLETFAPYVRSLGFHSMLARPVLVEGQCQAIIVVAAMATQQFSDQTEAVISSVAAMAAMSLKHATEQDIPAIPERPLPSTAIPTTVLGLSEIVRTHRVMANNRPDELEHYAYEIALRLNLSESECWNIRVAAMVCDLGMITVPEAILTKEGKLTPEEWAIVQQHPLTGESMLRGYGDCEDLLPIVRHHHERWDGSGYPDHLAGEDIPLGARVLAVADTYVSMQTMRPHRTPRTSDDALLQIRELSGSLFDPAVVQALEKVDMIQVSDVNKHDNLPAGNG